jgi:hypothetical protein
VTSTWHLVLLALGGSAATIAVNAWVIDRIYGRKERKWDSFCAKVAENERRILAIEARLAPAKFEKWQ